MTAAPHPSIPPDPPAPFPAREEEVNGKREVGAILEPAPPAPVTDTGDDGIDYSRLRSGLPAIATDISMGILFFAVVRLVDLRTAALASAGVGLALVPVQWAIRRIVGRRLDLLGGMAPFGIALLLLSGAYSWAVETELALQLKGSVLGLIVAVAYGADFLVGGRWLGRRLTLYLAYTDLDARRLAAGMAGVGLALAGLNTAFAVGTSRDTWLWYSAWGDTVASMVLASFAVQRARQRPAPVDPA